MICTIISTGEELLVENKNEHEPPYPLIKAKLQELVWRLYCQGYDSFYVNCEYGVPLWVAEFIAYLKPLNNITLNIVVPYEEQAVQWSEEQRDCYFRLHEKADCVTLANAQYHPNCYREANQLMIDESDLLVICGNTDSMPEATEYAEQRNIQACYYPVL